MKDEILNEEFMDILQPKNHRKIKITTTLIASLVIIATTILLVEHFKFDWFKSEVYNIDTKNGVSETIELIASTTYDNLDYDINTKKLVKKTCSNPSSITGSERYLRSGWYVVSSNVLSKYRIEISWKVNIILCDGYIWKTLYGLNVESGNELIIFGQNGGTGQLESKTSSKTDEAIGGGERQSVGDITINSGKVMAHSYGGSYAAGIGAGCFGIGGKVTINGGFVDAFSSDGAGIGGSVYGACGTTIINGGEVIAKSSQGAGIGGGPLKDGGSVSIYGGKVTAQSGYGSGIGWGAHSKESGTLKIGSGITLYGGDSESSLKVMTKIPTDNVTSRTKYMKAI